MPAWFVNASTSWPLAKPLVMATLPPTRFGLSTSLTLTPGSIGVAGAFSVYASAPLVVVTTGGVLVTPAVGVGVSVGVSVDGVVVAGVVVIPGVVAVAD